MMDHNPAPLKTIFYFCLDALLFLCQDPENVIAVHCKAGKGRTGLAIASYITFMEGSQDAYEAVKIFNNRRTIDNQGLKIPSQIRYVHYFSHFMNSNFKKPYKQLVAPYIRNPAIYDKLFEPSEVLKLTSITLGPFLVNPDFGKGMKVEIKIFDFNKQNIFESAFLDKKDRAKMDDLSPRSKRARV
jgi:hypothetical protein